MSRHFDREGTVGIVRIGFTLGLGALLAVALAAGASGKAGDIYIGNDGEGDTVVRIKPGSGAQKLIADGAPITAPSGMGFAPNGKLYEADYELPGIVQINPRTGATDDLASGPPFFEEPLDVERGPDGFLYVAEESGTNRGILRVNPRNGNTTSFVDDTGFIDSPFALTIRHRDGSIFVADNDGEVVRVKRNGDQELVSDDPDLGTPQGIALTPNGKLYVAEDLASTILRVNIRTGAAEVVATDPLLEGVYNIDAEPRGTIVAAAQDTTNVPRVNVKTGAVSTVSEGNLITGPEGIAVEPPKCGGKLATIVGSTGRDRLVGSRFDDVIAGLGGGDTIDGGRGDDIVCGGPGGDELDGDSGRDRLDGQGGNDDCSGGPGRDRERSC